LKGDIRGAFVGWMRNAQKIVDFKNPLEDLGVGGRIILKRILKKNGAKIPNVFIWLRIFLRGGLLWTR
jgi:hypothetical protein